MRRLLLPALCASLLCAGGGSRADTPRGRGSCEPIAIGRVCDGVVKTITDYGVYVQLGPGTDGLLHIVDVSWARHGELAALFHVGEPLRVVVLKHDPASGRISLGRKQLTPDPWQEAPARYRVGARTRGVVIACSEEGALLELAPGVEGVLAPRTRRSDRERAGCHVGAKLDVVVTAVDAAARRLSLRPR